MGNKSYNYLQCRDQILKLIREENIQPGNRLPSINQLVKKLDFGRISVQKAISMLVEEKVVETLSKKGTFFLGFPETMPTEDDSPSLPLSRFGMVNSSRKTLRIGIVGELAVYDKNWVWIIEQAKSISNPVDIDLIPITNHYEMLEKNVIKGLDILYCRSALLPGFIANDQLYSLSQINGDEINLDDLYPSTKKAVTFHGQLWGIPLSCGFSCDFVNQNHFSKVETVQLSSLEYLKRLEQLQNFLPKKQLVDGQSMVFGSLSPIQQYLLSNSENEISLRQLLEAERRKFLDFLEGLARFYQLPGLFFKDLDFPQANKPKCFLEQQVQISSGNSSWFSEINTSCQFPCTLIPPTTFESNNIPMETMAAVITTYSRFPEEAKQFLSLFPQAENQVLWAKAGQITSNREANQELPELKNLKNNREIIDKSLTFGKPIFYLESDTLHALRDVCSHEFTRFIQRECTAEQLLTNLTRQLDFYYRACERRLGKNEP